MPLPDHVRLESQMLTTVVGYPFSCQTWLATHRRRCQCDVNLDVRFFPCFDARAAKVGHGHDHRAGVLFDD